MQEASFSCKLNWQNGSYVTTLHILRIYSLAKFVNYEHKSINAVQCNAKGKKQQPQWEQNALSRYRLYAHSWFELCFSRLLISFFFIIARDYIDNKQLIEAVSTIIIIPCAIIFLVVKNIK